MPSLAGTGALTRLALRRDRIVLPAWLYLLTAPVASTAVSFKPLYPTAAGRAALRRHRATTRRCALYGRLYGDSLGALTTWRIGIIGAVGWPR